MEEIDLGARAPRWLNENDAGRTFEIIGIRNVSADKKRLDLEMHLRDGYDTARLSLWGSNLNYMINVYGNLTSKWVGQNVCVKIEKVGNKVHRILERAP
jgi:hypothetical protein